jgi:predicted nucleic acid-binding protein
LTVLFDSWAWIEYFRKGKRAEEVREYVDKDIEIMISAITVSEVYRWLLHHEQEGIAVKATKGMIGRSHVIPLDTEIAWNAAELKHKHKWGLGDSLIYATARKKDIDLVTGDSDFKCVEHVVYLGE